MITPTDLVMPRSGDGRSFVTSYRSLLQIFIDAGFVFATHAAAFVDHQTPSKSLFMRHDVDHKLDVALAMARIENGLGVRSSYYLLHPGDYDKDENYFGTVVDGRIRPAPGLMTAAHELVSLGHEVGLHNDLAQLSVKTGRPIAELLTDIMEMFATQGIRIAGTASHGSRFARKYQFVNYQIFAECLPAGQVPRTINIDERHEIKLFDLPLSRFGLSYEAYSIKHDCRIADTGGRFTIGLTVFEDVDFELVRKTIEGTSRVVMLIHPDWWIETAPAKIRETPTADDHAGPIFRRADGKPLRIAVRGDCCSRRMVSMNPELFPDGVELQVNEKCPNLAVVDSLRGLTVTGEELLEICETERMSATLRQYYLHQNERSVLDMRDLDLLVMDSYSDMNFELWEMRDRGCKLWIHPQFLRDGTALAQSLQRIGRATIDDAVRHVIAVIDHVRTLNPGLPVLFLPQPVDFYPKLGKHRAFDQLGARVAKLRAGVFAAAPLSIDELEPDDVGSCGPGLTLHFTGPTYRRMVDHAWRQGLMRHFDGTDQARAEVDAAKRIDPPPPLPAVALQAANSSVQRAGGPIARIHDIAAYARTFDSPLAVARWAMRRVWARVFARLSAPAAQASTIHSKKPPTPSAVGLSVDAAPTPPPRTPDVAQLPRVSLSFERGTTTCIENCGLAIDRAHISYREYFCFPALESQRHKRYKPMLISFDELCDFAAWERHIKSFGKGARLRQKFKAVRLGYVFHQFAWPQFIPDVHDINHSKEVRSGGAMRGSYQRTIAEMGGAPQHPTPIVTPACTHHWSANFGAFLPEPGHRQGEVVVDERLVAYIVLQRTGEVLLYSMILGHGEHLPNGVLVLLHHELVAWIGAERNALTHGVRYLMYGGRENGGESLLQWKRQAGFTPQLVDAVDAY